MTWILLALMCLCFRLNPDPWCLDPDHIELPQLWTHAFMHGDLKHLLTNGLCLAVMGFVFELRWGARSLLLFFLGTTALTAVAQAFATPAAGDFLGASGAIFALAGTWTVGERQYVFGGLVGALLTYAWLADEPNVGHIAHLSGFFLGLLWSSIAVILPQDDARSRRSRRTSTTTETPSPS